MKQTVEATERHFILSTIKCLIHGRRISHLKGPLASLLNIKPIIYSEKAGGTYINRGQACTIARAIDALADIVASTYPPETAIQMQILHSHYPQGAANLHKRLDRIFECNWPPQIR